jgi:hypothetical protein
MTEFGILAQKVDQIDIYGMMREITRKNSRKIKDIVQNRIQRTGIDAEGNKIQTDQSSTGQVYSNATIRLKEKKSGIAGVSDHVTLTDSGALWRTFELYIKNNGFILDLDTDKGAVDVYENFTQDYGTQKLFKDSVEGLNEKELDLLASEIYFPEILNKINEILQR